jgi:hypothetical protein
LFENSTHGYFRCGMTLFGRRLKFLEKN